MRDKIHYAVRRALEKDGWTILKDPFPLKLKDVTVEVDLEAEKFFEVEKDNQRILVEIKTLNRTSILYAFYGAYGQYDFYRKWVNDNQSGHILYLAVSLTVYGKMLKISDLIDWITERHLNLVVVDIEDENVAQWINY